jgi:chloramphenicol-sensitive protein RarD
MTGPNSDSRVNPRRRSLAGVLYAAGAFLIWGFSPVYWKALLSVPALEIIAHRTVWAFLFLAVLTIAQKRWVEVLRVLKTPRIMGVLFVTAILVCINWLVYVWAVNAGYLLQASLGYFINPLVNVLLGMIFLRERLSRNQTVAVVIAGLAVIYRTVAIGQFPWVAMTLGLGFGFYGLIRKIAPVTSLVGLTVETLWLVPCSAGYLIYLDLQGQGALLRTTVAMDALLIGTGVVTAVPLLFFNLGARRINLSSVGLMQFIAPTCMFLLAVVAYGEPFSVDQLGTFALIWAALAIYSIDSLHQFRHPTKP